MLGASSLAMQELTPGQEVHKLVDNVLYEASSVLSLCVGKICSSMESAYPFVLLFFLGQKTLSAIELWRD